VTVEPQFGVMKSSGDGDGYIRYESTSCH
jgi:hypothetical protein